MPSNMLFESLLKMIFVSTAFGRRQGERKRKSYAKVVPAEQFSQRIISLRE